MSNDFADFLQKKGLYDSIIISESNIDELCDLIGGKVKISEYCSVCKEKRVFTMEPISIGVGIEKDKKRMCSLAEILISYQVSQKNIGMVPAGNSSANPNWYWTNWQTEEATRVLVFSFVCAMDNNHHLDYIVRTDGNIMTKIGQYPSVADLEFHELDEYKKDIDAETMKEFRRAIGLYAQGIGVGSFVYLRRIFERILDKSRNLAEMDPSVDLSNYEKMRVTERIKLLKGYLPDMIISNPTFYGIVSKGIHELSEEECIKYFPILKDAIELILRQWAQKRIEQEARQRLGASLSTIATELL